MGIAEIWAFFRALPEMVKVLGQVNETLMQLKRDSLNREIESIKKDVDLRIKTLILAKTDQERKDAIIALSNSLSR